MSVKVSVRRLHAEPLNFDPSNPQDVDFLKIADCKEVKDLFRNRGHLR